MTAVSITVRSKKVKEFIQILLEASLPQSVEPSKKWEDLTADDYRTMLKNRRPVFKAKSLQN